MRNKQVGLTYIELMIALMLGVIISTAATMIFIAGQRSMLLQHGAADLQDNANFGLNLMTKDIRLLNLDNNTAFIKSNTPLGGVVLTSSVNPENSDNAIPIQTSNLYITIEGDTAALNLLSRSEIGPSNVRTSSETALGSDQLVIQFIPQYVVQERSGKEYYFGGFDCEGNELLFEKEANNRGKRMVVQRYFLRLDSNQNAQEPNQALALACDAGTYEPANSDGTEFPESITNYGDNGQIIMSRVDFMRILLGVNNDGQYRYMPVQEYMALTGTKPRIISIQIGILARSTQQVGRENAIDDDQEFNVLDKTVLIKPVTNNNAPKYVRQVVSQTVALRNGLGGRGS